MNADPRHVSPDFAAGRRVTVRTIALCVVSLVVSGCGGDEQFRRDLTDSVDRIADVIVEEISGIDPSQPELTPTTSPIGSVALLAVDGMDDGYITTAFDNWGYVGQMVSEDTATCTALDCVPAGEETLFTVYLGGTDVVALREADAEAEQAAVDTAAARAVAEGARDQLAAAATAARDAADVAAAALAEAEAAVVLAADGTAEAQAAAEAAAALAAVDAAAALAEADAAAAAEEAAQDEATLAAARALVARADADAAAAALALGLEADVDTIVEGTPSGSSPVSGSAVWAGGVRAYSTHVVDFSGTDVTTYAGVEGDSRLEVDFESVSVDVDFTNFSNGQANMSWSGLTMDNGVFGYGTISIDGSFYGENHEGAAGTFTRDGLTGVFGATRTP